MPKKPKEKSKEELIGEITKIVDDVKSTAKSEELKRVVNLIKKAHKDKDVTGIHIFTAIENMAEIIKYVKEIGMDENSIILHDAGDEERICRELNSGLGNDKTMTKIF